MKASGKTAREAMKAMSLGPEPKPPPKGASAPGALVIHIGSVPVEDDEEFEEFLSGKRAS